jgi:hypothetical protein
MKVIIRKSVLQQETICPELNNLMLEVPDVGK